MRLNELQAEFITSSEMGSAETDVFPVGIEEADGIFFLCPVCFVKNGGDVGTHGIICWRPRVREGIDPGPGRWEFSGTGIGDLTLLPGPKSGGRSSVDLSKGPATCGAHFSIKNGVIC